MPVRLEPSSRSNRYEEPAAHQPPAPPAPPAAPAAPPQPPTPEPKVPTLGSQIVQSAAKYLGSRYAFGGASPVTGFDCSGFVQWVMQQVGIDVPRVVAQQYGGGHPVSRSELEPGDMVFFVNTYMRGLSHVGIYVGDGQFIDAGTERTGVRRARLDDPYWSSRFVGGRRLE